MRPHLPLTLIFSLFSIDSVLCGGTTANERETRETTLTRKLASTDAVMTSENKSSKLSQLPAEEIVCESEMKKLNVSRCFLLSKKLQLFVLYNPFKADASKNDEITFHFRIFGEVYKNDEIEKIRNGHWLGFGFSKSGSMKGADFGVLRQMSTDSDKDENLSTNTAWAIQDYFGEDFSRPVLDAKQNYKLVSYSDDSVSGLHFEVKREKETCDYFFDEQFNVGDWHYMLWAYGEDSYTGGKFWSYHGPSSRGTKMTPLFDVPTPALPAKYDTVAVRMGSKEVSTDENGKRVVKTKPIVIPTTAVAKGHTNPMNQYVCSYTMTKDLFPDDPEDAPQRTAINFKPILSAKSKKYVHHILVFACENENSM